MIVIHSPAKVSEQVN